MLSREDLEELAECLKVLTHPVRIRILACPLVREILREIEITVVTTNTWKDCKKDL